jgi:hypothetical protein
MDDVFGHWADFVKETNCLVPANYYHELSYYKILPENVFFIDGGKGEFLRRGLSNRLAVFGRKALLNKEMEGIAQYLFLKKPGIFSKDITRNWNLSINQQVESLLNSMPNVRETGVENWIDLYNIRFRTGNSGYVSQSRLDCILPNLMPFIQPVILNAVLNLPPAYRSKELIMKKMLDQNRILKFFPLARYNKYSSLIWSKVMQKIIKEKSNQIDLFLSKNREYNLSRISDSGFINSSIYNKNIIKKTVIDYYAGKSTNQNLLLWWMTFDVWNKLILEN